MWTWLACLLYVSQSVVVDLDGGNGESNEFRAWTVVNEVPVLTLTPDAKFAGTSCFKSFVMFD